MILDLVRFISTHFQPKPSHGDQFQAKFWSNCQPYKDQIFGISDDLDLIFWISDDFDKPKIIDKPKKMRNVRTIIFHPFSYRDLCHVSENEGFRFVKKIFFQLKT